MSTYFITQVDAVTGIIGAEAKDAPALSAGAESEEKDTPASSAKGAGIEPTDGYG